MYNIFTHPIANGRSPTLCSATCAQCCPVCVCVCFLYSYAFLDAERHEPAAVIGDGTRGWRPGVSGSRSKNGGEMGNGGVWVVKNETCLVDAIGDNKPFRKNSFFLQPRHRALSRRSRPRESTDVQVLPHCCGITELISRHRLPDCGSYHTLCVRRQ